MHSLQTSFCMAAEILHALPSAYAWSHSLPRLGEQAWSQSIFLLIPSRSGNTNIWAQKCSIAGVCTGSRAQDATF